MSPAVSLDEAVSSTPELVLGSKLLGQVSSVRGVACRKAQHELGLFLLHEEAVSTCITQTEDFGTWGLAGGC